MNRNICKIKRKFLFPLKPEEIKCTLLEKVRENPSCGMKMQRNFEMERKT